LSDSASALKGFQHNLWKSLLKTALFGAQTSEIRGLLALCTHFVQTCCALRTPIIYTIAVAALQFLGIS
jgi:hypothetical protein